MRTFAIIFLAMFVTQHIAAEQIPIKSSNDARVRYADYKKDDVVTVAVAQGVITRIVLSDDETITNAHAGFPSRCDKELDEWCIKAETGSNQIWVKPRLNANLNNLEVATNKRDYSLRFVVMSGAEKAKAVYYRVLFRYPAPLPPPGSTLKLNADSDAGPNSKGTQELDTPTVRNANYSKQISPEGQDIAPTTVFDDGRFTYFKFPKAREIPSVFAIGAAGEEVRVNFSAHRLQPDAENPDAHVPNDYLVVHRLSKKFILRLGVAVVNIINNDFNVDGVETYNGTTTNKVVRDTK